MIAARLRVPSFAYNLCLCCCLILLLAAGPALAQTGSFAEQGVNLGSVAVNTGTPATATLTFTFTEGGTIAAPAVVTQGAKNMDFTDAGTGTCTTNGTSHVYNGNATCTVKVNFTPKLAGAREGAVVLSTTTGAAIGTAYIYGNGTGPQVIFNHWTDTAVGGGLGQVAAVAVDGSGNVYTMNGGGAAVNGVFEIPPGCASSSCMTPLGGGFDSPAAIAVDGAGNVYVTDSGLNTVFEMPPGCTSDRYNSSLCGIATLGGGLDAPGPVTVDGSGNVYVGDGSSGVSLKKIPAGCASSSCVTTLESGFGTLTGIAADAGGDIYVTSFVWNSVYEVPAGCATSNCMVKLPGSFYVPFGIAVDGSGNVYLGSNTWLYEIPNGCASSGCVVTWTGFFDGADGVAVDAKGNIYVANNYAKQLNRLDRADPPSLNFAATADGASSPDSPQTVTIENLGNQPLTFPIPSSGNNPSISANFTLDSSGATACPLVDIGSGAAGTLTPGSSCDLSISFTPGSGVHGDVGGALVLTDNSLNATAGYAQQALLLGGIVPEIIVTGEDDDAGSVVVSSASYGSLTVTFRLASGGTVSAPAVLTEGAKNLDFTDAGTGTCTTNGTGHVYNAGDSCTVAVNFKPRFTGVRYGAVVLSDSSNQPFEIAYIQGTGAGPQVAFTPSALIAVGGGFTAPYGVAMDNGYNIPYGLAVDESGNVYVADATNNDVEKISAGCVSSDCKISVGGGFSQPQGVAVDGAGNVYVADTGNGVAKEVPADCTSAACVIAVGGGISHPMGIAVDGSGNVFVTSYQYWTVIEIPAGCFSSSCMINISNAWADSITDINFDGPLGTVVDNAGNLYVASTASSVVTEVPAGCTSSSCVIHLRGGFNSPFGLALDGNRNLYIADTGNNAVKVLPAGCTWVGCMITLGTGFVAPVGVAVDGSGNVYVADASHNQIQELDRIDAPSLSFTPVSDGSAASSITTETLTVQNIGNEKLLFPDPASGSNPSISGDFIIGSGANKPCPLTGSGAKSGGSLSASASCNLEIVFTPQIAATGYFSVGSYSGSLALTDNTLNAGAPNYASQTVVLSGTVTPTPPFGAMAQPVDATTRSTTVGQSDNVLITGWAADPQMGAPISQVSILIDGTAVGNGSLGIAEPGVVTKYNNFAYYNSGWTFTYPAAGLAVGSHQVTAVIADSLGLTTQLRPRSFSVAGTASYGPPFGAMGPAIDATTRSTTVATGDNLLVTGWAADPHDGAPVSSVSILIDGATVGTATLGIARPDVAAAQKNAAYLNSGWSFTMAGSGLSTGTHTVSAAATDSLGMSSTLGKQTITVAASSPDGPPFGSLGRAVDSSTGQTTLSQSDNLLVEGWAADVHDGAPVSQVSILVDGTAAGNATLGIAQPGMAKILGARYTNSGWKFTLAASSLSAGTHTITAVATDSLGLSTQFQIREITVTP